MEELRETLVAKLNDLGVCYLAPSDAVATVSIPSDDALLKALLEQSDSRLRLAIIPLLLRHPDLAENIQKLNQQSEPSMAIELQTYYMAAVYLQRLWKRRLGLYLDTNRLLPDFFRNC